VGIKCKETVKVRRTEMCKEIRGLEGRYNVDKNGNVFSHINGIKLKPYLVGAGYYYVNLAGKSRPVHRIVAEAFLPDFLEKPQVNHIDGNKLNNHISNLEMVSAKENILHAYKTGLKVSLKGENHTNSKLSAEDVTIIKMLLRKGETGTSLARKFGVSQTTISYIKSGIAWK